METRNNINPRPFQPVSPGCILKEELETRSLPISDFAHKIGLEEFELDKLLNGTLCLSPEIASSLERFLGIPRAKKKRHLDLPRAGCGSYPYYSKNI